MQFHEGKVRRRINSGAAVSAGVTLEDTLSAPAPQKLKTEDRVRAVSFRGFDGTTYHFIANFETDSVSYTVEALADAFSGGTCGKEIALQAGEAVLLKEI